MMRKSIIVMFFVMLLMLSGCAQTNYETESTSEIYENTTVDYSMDSTSEGLTEPENSSTQQTADTTAEITLQAETGMQENETAANEPVSDSSVTEIDLTISMPEKNGEMYTDKSPDNKYIKIVCEERGFAPELLVAVFSVPESGQNYVFEFKDETGRDVNDIRRVYLIDSFGKISGVAAANGAEKEKVSSVENWFCMNVLIKEIIYPAIEKDVR